MAGRWCAIKDGALGPEKEDKLLTRAHGAAMITTGFSMA
jgi:hypothetical protein